MAQPAQQVKIDELQSGMIIQEITELSIDYASLDPETLKFVQTVFKGASALVLDENGTRTIPVSELKPFDQLQGLTAIPAALKAARVTEDTAELMAKHGLLEFKVIGSGKPITIKKPKAVGVGSEEAKKLHEIKREQVKQFVDTVATASTNRVEASLRVEEMLDQGRTGRISTKGVEVLVDEIVKTGSAPAMKAIAGLRGSDQTYAHCTDMSVILEECYTAILKRNGKAPSEPNRRFTLLSGFMHDIGKSEVPKDVLDSTSRFAPDSKEMLILRNHTTYGARILKEMGMPDIAINIAQYHHVKKDSTLLTSYPKVSYENVNTLTRLAAVADVYQALIGRRRYKKNWVPGKAIEYLLNLRDSEFDERVLDQFIESVGRYPVGSLVRLSTGDLAFVLMIAPREHPERPIVAVVENAQGELLTSHTLLDLMLEPELNIAEVVDHYEHYDQSEDQAYQIFQSIHVN